MLAESYHSAIVERIKADDFTLSRRAAHRPSRARVRLLLRRRPRGRLRVPDARALSRSPRLPDRRNHPQPARQRQAARDGHPLPQRRAGERIDRLAPDDVVILPAFGVTVAMLQQLERRGCTLVDTTCGSVLNVWKNVRRYAEGGYTSIIHGKVWHEETQATASQAVEYGGALSRRLRPRRGRASSATTSARGGDRDAFLRALRQAPRRPASIPIAICSASASPTRRRC